VHATDVSNEQAAESSFKVAQADSWLFGEALDD